MNEQLDNKVSYQTSLNFCFSWCLLYCFHSFTPLWKSVANGCFRVGVNTLIKLIKVFSCVCVSPMDLLTFNKWVKGISHKTLPEHINKEILSGLTTFCGPRSKFMSVFIFFPTLL